MKTKIIDKCKAIKAGWDAFTVMRKVLIMISAIASIGGGYWATSEPLEEVMIPVVVPSVQPEVGKTITIECDLEKHILELH